MTDDTPISHIVHLVRSFGDDATAPREIQFGRRLRPSALAILWVLLVAGTLSTSLLVLFLWISDSPGWWFNLIFTLLPAFFLAGCGMALTESRKLSRREAQLAERWHATRNHARPSAGRVIDRTVSLMEHGSVSSFTLTVDIEGASRIRARWYRSNPENADATLLQTQIPAIGSKARVWSVGVPNDDEPLIVEALDASIVIP
ncbi:hypothetical protein ACIBTZ_33680 [Micromonospora sp. NPDC049460]|uniref:hypothetical protein n=1 Tax=Micromonospora sp. NPDC049460 TaxID=3364272 RepID=UPI0037B69671